jgi:hypothetical protein
MQATEKKQFMAMLADTLAAYAKPLPEGALLAAWWSNLEPFPLRAVAMAFSEYRSENGEFAPVPAGIAKRCKLMDGRPTDEEAWAIALTSRNEEDTVVWTSETAEAFGICSPILALGDEVGARMAFKDTYNRLFSAARAAYKSADWNVSLGWDGKKREAAIKRASVAGYLSAPVAQALLPDYSGSSEREGKSPEGLARLKEEVAKLQAGWALNAERRAAELQAERAAVAARKSELAEQAATYRQERSSRVAES